MRPCRTCQRQRCPRRLTNRWQPAKLPCLRCWAGCCQRRAGENSNRTPARQRLPRRGRPRRGRVILGGPPTRRLRSGSSLACSLQECDRSVAGRGGQSVAGRGGQLAGQGSRERRPVPPVRAGWRHEYPGQIRQLMAKPPIMFSSQACSESAPGRSSRLTLLIPDSLRNIRLNIRIGLKKSGICACCGDRTGGGYCVNVQNGLAGPTCAGPGPGGALSNQVPGGTL